MTVKRIAPLFFLFLWLGSDIFSVSRERWCKPAESWFCTFLLPCRFLSRVSLGKIKGRGRPWGEGLAENAHTGITSPKHIVSAVWCCLHVIKASAFKQDTSDDPVGVCLRCDVVLSLSIFLPLYSPLCFFSPPTDAVDDRLNKHHSHVWSYTLLCEAPWNWH